MKLTDKTLSMCLIDNPQAVVYTAVDAVSRHYSDNVTGQTSCHELGFKTVMVKSSGGYVNKYNYDE